MAVRAFLRFVNISPPGWRGEITDNRQLIGRSEAADIKLPNEFRSVSRRHAEIWYDERDVWLLDLASRGGTRLNGIWLQPNAAVRTVPGDRISLAGVELRLAGADPSRSQTSPVAEEAGDATVCSASDRAIALYSKIARLTPAELQILLWVRRGLDDDLELGRRLHRSPHTVRTQVASIFRKLEVHSRSNLLSLLNRVDVILDSE